MKKIIMIFSLSLIMMSCYDNIPNETQEQKRLSKESYQSVGLPDIKNFYEKKTLKKILEMRDNPNIINHLYTRNAYTGKWIYEGKCIGFGIPYTTQYTNPEYVGGPSSAPYTLPLADPNGLYSVPSGTATWIIKVSDDGTQTVEYIESEIRVTQKKIDRKLVEEWSLPSDY